MIEMPSIPKGAKLNDADKKKLEKLKKKGATRSELSTIRMALLRGDTWRKASMKAKKKASSSASSTKSRADKKPSMKEEISEEVVDEEPM